jgi:NAD(P)-dependent dehydrogenase (short-subunit alcohol dehydrogenase family)
VQALGHLINNAGAVEPIFYGSGAYEGNDDPNLRNYDFDAWLELLKTNVLGPARVCGAFVDNLSAGERSVAVNISSTLALRAATRADPTFVQSKRLAG